MHALKQNPNTACDRETKFIAKVKNGFSIVELLVSMTVLALMLVVTASVIGQMQRAWRSTSGKLSQFREARIAFETITRNLRQATLNTYSDFYYLSTGSNIPSDNNPTESPVGYARISELGFTVDKASTVLGEAESITPGHSVFFQAPLGVTEDVRYRGLNNLLCTRAYFVKFGDDANYIPDGLRTRLQTKNRYRLLEYQPPAEDNQIYGAPNNWRQLNAEFLRPVAENIVALIISPRLTTVEMTQSADSAREVATSIAPGYSFNSSADGVNGDIRQGMQHLLPPVVQITMIAIDEPSMEKLLISAPTASPDLLQRSGATFSSAVSYDSDLAAVEAFLLAEKLNYRIFQSSVVLPASRWAAKN